jgi:hypothetical protein
MGDEVLGTHSREFGRKNREYCEPKPKPTPDEAPIGHTTEQGFALMEQGISTPEYGFFLSEIAG